MENPEQAAFSADKQKYKDYCKSESDEAYSTILKNQEEYDKQLLTLSTGLLAVLLAFLKDVVHLDSSIHRWLLYGGFAGLGLTILLVIISFQVSNYVLEEVREHWKREYNEEKGAFPESLARYVKYINWAGGACFILGVSLVFSFITINLSKQSGNGDGHGESKLCSNSQISDKRGCSTEGSKYQGSYPICPEGEYCKYTEIYEIGVPMANPKVIAMDGAPAKSPQMKVNGGATPKKPITTGSSKK